MKKRCTLFLLALTVCTVSSLAQSAGGDTLRLLFTGDVLLDRGVRQQLRHMPADSLFSGVRSLFATADAVMINLECPLSSASHPVSKQIIFRADTAMASVMRRSGVTHASLANNHSIDQGYTGLAETASALASAGIVTTGYGTDSHSRLKPAIIQKGNLRVAVYSNNAVPLENWPSSSPTHPDILNISTDSLCSEIRRFTHANPTVPVVVFVHWGTEFRTLPDLTQRIHAIRLLSSGATAIVGHHPHVTQPFIFSGQKPIFYSLGNFIFDQRGNGRDHGIIAELTFTSQGLSHARSHPIIIRDCIPQTAISPK